MNTNFTSQLYREIVFSCFFIVPFLSEAQISGTVFRDLDNDGVLDATELPEAGIRVVAYNAAGDSVTQTTTTSAAGDNYTFSGLTLPVRLEFRVASYLYASRGSIANTTVQFYSAANSAADLAVQYPVMYCQQTPDVVIPCYVAGNPEGGGTAGTTDALIRFPYTNSGTSPSPTSVAVASQIGTVWGSAYQRESKKLVLAAFLKRHCGLETTGLGGLFLADLTSAPGSVTSYIDVEDFGINLGSSVLAGRSLPASASSSSTDPLGFDYMGKIGMGSIDLSDDGKVLWAVNLNTKQIFSFQIGNPVKSAGSVTAADFESFAIPNPGCTNGVARPWALEYHEGKVYVGVICSGESAGGSASNLFAYVYRFNPTTETWDASPVISFALNYPKGDVHESYPNYDVWETWSNVFSDIHDAGTVTGGATRKIRPQPILSDIQFDKRGYMLLGFCDRTGHLTGRLQVSPTGGSTLYNGYIGGDVLYAKSNGSGGWTLESNGQFSGGPVGGGVGNNEGPGGGEFFPNENFGTTHHETMQGGISYHPGRDEIMTNLMDPFAVWTGGVGRHSVVDGSSNATTLRYEIYDTSTGANGTFGKANGLGMVEFNCDAAPVEIGNRVWVDTDLDGKQDPGESPVSGLTVQLLNSGGTVIGTATTDANGLFLFSNATATSTASVIYNIATLLPYGSYTVRVPNVQGGSKQAALGINILTLSNVGGAGSPDLRDSDGILTGNNADAAITLNASGENNHSIDFGFKPACVQPDLSAVNPAAVCSPATVSITSSWTDNNGASAGSGTVSYHATAADAGANTNAISGTGISVTGDYWVRKTMSIPADCYDTVRVHVTINPAASVSVNDAEICSGQTATLTATGTGTSLWNTGAMTSSINVTPVPTTTYTVTLTNGSGCTATDSGTVTVVPQPAAGSDVLLVCNAGSAPTTYDLGQSGNWSVFSQPGGANAQVNGSGVVSNLTVVGGYVLRLSVNGSGITCQDDVLITVPVCCPVPTCMPVQVIKY